MIIKFVAVFSLCLLEACGSKHEVKFKDVPKDIKITFGPDMERVFEICDYRYGYKSLESEKCIQNYMTYTKLQLAVDPQSIDAYCEAAYTDPVEVEDCKTGLDETLGM